MERADYFIRRFLLVIPTFIGITFTCFLLIQFVPGGPVEQALMKMKGVADGGQATVSANAASISEEQRQQIEVSTNPCTKGTGTGWSVTASA